MTDVSLPLPVPERFDLGAWFAASGVDPNSPDCVWFEVAAADAAYDIQLQEVWLSWPDQFGEQFGRRMAEEIDLAARQGQIAEDSPLDDEMFALQAIQHAHQVVDEELSRQFGEYFNQAV